MKQSTLLLSEDTALRFGKSLSWLLIYHVSRGWTIVSTTIHPAVGKTYTLSHPLKTGPTYAK